MMNAIERVFHKRFEAVFEKVGHILENVLHFLMLFLEITIFYHVSDYHDILFLFHVEERVKNTSFAFTVQIFIPSCLSSHERKHARPLNLKFRLTALQFALSLLS